jgi:ribose 5-phosphate isomerase RpiB
VKIALATDHAGFELKEDVAGYLRQLGQAGFEFFYGLDRPRIDAV